MWESKLPIPIHFPTISLYPNFITTTKIINIKNMTENKSKFRNIHLNEICKLRISIYHQSMNLQNPTKFKTLVKFTLPPKNKNKKIIIKKQNMKIIPRIRPCVSRNPREEHSTWQDGSFLACSVIVWTGSAKTKHYTKCSNNIITHFCLQIHRQIKINVLIIGLPFLNQKKTKGD